MCKNISLKSSLWKYSWKSESRDQISGTTAVAFLHWSFFKKATDSKECNPKHTAQLCMIALEDKWAKLLQQLTVESCSNFSLLFLFTGILCNLGVWNNFTLNYLAKIFIDDSS